MASLEEFSIHVNDVEKCMEYYMKIPDAKLELHIPNQFVKIRIGRNVLQLVKVELQPPFHIEVETDDLDGLYEKFQDEGLPTEELKTQFWGQRTFFSRDPEGNNIEFTSKRA